MRCCISLSLVIVFARTHSTCCTRVVRLTLKPFAIRLTISQALKDAAAAADATHHYHLAQQRAHNDARHRRLYLMVANLKGFYFVKLRIKALHDQSNEWGLINWMEEII